MTQHFNSINEYISSFPAEVQTILQELRSHIKHELPESVETISYNMPTFNIGNDKVIFFAAWKKHISIYPFTENMAKQIPKTAAYEISGKGTIQFPLDQSLPLDIISNIIKIRLQEIKVEKQKAS